VAKVGTGHSSDKGAQGTALRFWCLASVDELFHAEHDAVALQQLLGIMDNQPAEVRAKAELAKAVIAAAAWLQWLSHQLGIPREVWRRVISFTLPTQVLTVGNEHKPR